MPRIAFRALAALGSAALLALAGCRAGGVGWSSYPPVRGQASFGNPNRTPMPQLVTAALRYTLDRYPPQTPPTGSIPEVAINLPDGFSHERYQEVAAALSSDRLFVYPITPDNANLPTYHVAQVKVRGGEATVDVLRPVYDLARGTGSSGGSLPQQGLTLELTGGFQPWQVTSRQIWAIGTIPVPAFNFLPAPGEVPTDGDDPEAPAETSEPLPAEGEPVIQLVPAETGAE